ncbi:glycosyltransferase family 2 protein [Leptospira stimsonii]|uniref:Glycosyl transferase family 2 n=1 Tax=Leptospira stimsonii TaxID=2202203 RepID=A0A4R9L3V4_9LEPT|nr:glycosyltransferase family 2 protein [Leptospira stimsonii]RHX86327.1 glycosyl transferase family 2 [Leptospira stimsonii]TGK14549.1 glycosyltransferase family 2 protein [Leptospira stimsonii]TGM09972.1 glycosyltransferase family 2 protein [Leptospira stimsonii]
MSPFYNSKDLCVLTPTKDRPNKIVNLLNSLTKQTAPVGRVIVIASGQDIRDVVEKYSKQLPLEYYYCEPPGQIRQRKLGVSKLDSRTKLVATLDDDIVLEPDAIDQIVQFWNASGSNTAGVGFNIMNMETHRYSKLREFFFFSSKLPGIVLESGFPTALTNVSADISTQWLNGGATTWRQDILVEKIHEKSVDAMWAPCEDLLFSYPVSKSYKLYVSSQSKVIHDDIIVDTLNFEQLKYRGYAISLWMISFVSAHRELKLWKTFIVILLTSLVTLVEKAVRLRFPKMGFEFGKLKGLWTAIYCLATGKEISKYIY